MLLVFLRFSFRLEFLTSERWAQLGRNWSVNLYSQTESFVCLPPMLGLGWVAWGVRNAINDTDKLGLKRVSRQNTNGQFNQKKGGGGEAVKETRDDKSCIYGGIAFQ